MKSKKISYHIKWYDKRENAYKQGKQKQLTPREVEIIMSKTN